MGLESVGPKNVVTNGPVAPKPTAKPEPTPAFALDGFKYSLPPAEPKLKLTVPEDDWQDPKPFLPGKSFESQPFKPHLGVREDLGDNATLDLGPSFKHGVGVKATFRKTF